MIRIGDFSRLARVSIRTLRHYEQEGLLHPARVDARTGYRYYRVEQLMMMQRIGALRDIGLSIVEIRQLLALDAEQFAARLGGLEQRLQRELHEAAARLLCLRSTFESLAAARRPATSLARLRALAPTVAFTLRQRVPARGPGVARLFEEAERRAARDRVDDSPFLIVHREEAACRPIDVEVCVPVRAGSAMPGVRRIDGTRQAACITFGGPYSQSDAVLRSLRAWIASAGTRAGGPRREVYHRFGADLAGYRLPPYRLAGDAADYVTEVQIPVGPAPR
jgi:DNA-binding transcriptional MerR regulator